MRSLVVYESIFGNTQQVAQAMQMPGEQRDHRTLVGA